MRPKREHIVPGQVLTVRPGHTLSLDAHRLLFGGSFDILDGGVAIVVTKPRKVDGINLVRVKINEVDEYETFYCDLLNHTELT